MWVCNDWHTLASGLSTLPTACIAAADPTWIGSKQWKLLGSCCLVFCQKRKFIYCMMGLNGIVGIYSQFPMLHFIACVAVVIRFCTRDLARHFTLLLHWSFTMSGFWLKFSIKDCNFWYLLVGYWLTHSMFIIYGFYKIEKEGCNRKVWQIKMYDAAPQRHTKMIFWLRFTSHQLDIIEINSDFLQMMIIKIVEKYIQQFMIKWNQWLSD